MSDGQQSEPRSQSTQVNKPSEVALEARVRQQLEILRLPCLGNSLDEILAWTRKERPAALSLIERVLAADAEHMQTRLIEHRLKDSGLPDRPNLETFDFDFQPSIDKALVLQLAELDFIAAHEDVVLTGNSGTGKSHVIKSLAVRAAALGSRSSIVASTS